MIGEVFKNNTGQEYRVIKRTVRMPNGNYKYLIRFTETGYEREVLKVEIDRGKIKDKLSPSVFSVGILGDVKMVDHKKQYRIWSGMIERCYNENCSSYSNYGGAGVTVCERWLTFTNFLEDFTKIEGYNEDKFNLGVLELDKDKKQQGSTKKVYSTTTCIFLTSKENNSLKNLDHRKLTFYGKSPTGDIVIIHGMGDFAKNNGMLRQGIYNCLKKKSSSCKGWTFSYERDDL